eukprot:6185888-Pleurochrysis_carterae.AAC.1
MVTLKGSHAPRSAPAVRWDCTVSAFTHVHTSGRCWWHGVCLCRQSPEEREAEGGSWARSDGEKS